MLPAADYCMHISLVLTSDNVAAAGCQTLPVVLVIIIADASGICSSTTFPASGRCCSRQGGCLSSQFARRRHP
jgi:hypothetical protein